MEKYIIGRASDLSYSNEFSPNLDEEFYVIYLTEAVMNRIEEVKQIVKKNDLHAAALWFYGIDTFTCDKDLEDITVEDLVNADEGTDRIDVPQLNVWSDDFWVKFSLKHSGEYIETPMQNIDFILKFFKESDDRIYREE